MTRSSQAIGIFDSGVGGLTVMQELMHALPHEQLIYFGDTARVPYGNKSSQTIIRYSIENTICLLEKNIKLLVVACNTVSAFALSKLRTLFNIPIVGVIEPGAKKAVAVTRNQRIAILGTKGTIQSGAYQTTILSLAPEANIFPISCPLLVPLVEEQWFDHPATQLVIQEYLRPIQTEQVDTLLLGCTHYPLLSSLIQQEIGKEVNLINSASTCATEVAYLLKEQNLLASHLQKSHQYYVSNDPEKFHSLAKTLFSHSLTNVDLLYPETLYNI